jgi:hypothetical protein
MQLKVESWALRENPTSEAAPQAAGERSKEKGEGTGLWVRPSPFSLLLSPAVGKLALFTSRFVG